MSTGNLLWRSQGISSWDIDPLWLKYSGTWFNMKMPSYQYGKYHGGDMTVLSAGWNFLYWWDDIFTLNQGHGPSIKSKDNINSHGIWNWIEISLVRHYTGEREQDLIQSDSLFCRASWQAVINTFYKHITRPSAEQSATHSHTPGWHAFQLWVWRSRRPHPLLQLLFCQESHKVCHKICSWGE